MFTARTTSRTPLVARHHRAGLPRAFDAPRPVALASWRMGGGGAPADANDAPPPRRARRRDDHDDDDDDDDESAFSRAPQRRGSRGRAPAAATAPARTDAPNLADAAALPATFPTTTTPPPLANRLAGTSR